MVFSSCAFAEEYLVVFIIREVSVCPSSLTGNGAKLLRKHCGEGETHDFLYIR